jgi:heterodisulfide reductase subunit B
VDTIQFLGSVNCRVNVGKQVGEWQYFSVPRHVPLANFSQFVALNMGLTVLKVQ